MASATSLLQAGVSVACCLVVFAPLDAALAQAVDATPVVFSTTANFHVTINNAQVAAHWNREVMRQALLLAARSELNHPTADNLLGDGVSRTKPSLQLTCTAGAPNRIQLLQGVSGERQPVWTHEFKFEAPWPWHRAWVERMEAMSRTTFVEALEKAKLTAREAPRPRDPAAPLDPELTQKIDEDLSFLGQFVALRRLHSEVVGDGETAARLAGLVRAYSHLGLLTECQWHPMSHGFKARALLYAQRWVVREPKSASARRHRAYAFALVGMHGDALSDLETAARMAADSPGESEAPAWLPLIERFCRYDFQGLKELDSEERLGPLASLLYFLSHEQEGSTNLSLRVGLELLERMPDCYRMLDTLSHHTGPGLGQFVTQVGPRHLAITLLPRLEETPELPVLVREALHEARESGAMLPADFDEEYSSVELAHRAKVIGALRGAATPADDEPDSVEPSWAVLAKIIEETTFLQVYHRAFFVGRQLGFPADDYIDAHRPVVASHRLIVFLDQFHTRADPQKLAEAVRSFDVANLDFAQARLWLLFPQSANNQLSRLAASHKAGLPNEQGLTARTYPQEVYPCHGPLVAVSPHSPHAMGMALRCSHAGPEDERAWEETAERSPYLAWSFSGIWEARGDLAKTEKFLKLAAQLDPSAMNFRRLAKHYQGRGDEENWLTALEQYLETPELGLEHAEIRSQIAAHFVQRREWDKALPYADAAAESGAQWALDLARSVNEANQNWTVAEQRYLETIARYGEHPLLWYFFCQRNGRGDVERARRAAFPAGVEQFVRRANVPYHYTAIILCLEEMPEQALEIYLRQGKTAPTSVLLMLAASLADQLGDHAARDALLQQAVDQPPPAEDEYDDRPHRRELVELARRFLDDLAAGGNGDFNFDELHAIRDRAPESARCSFNYILGCYLERRGKPESAIEYWKQCMGCSSLNLLTRTAAGFALQQRGVHPDQWKQLLFIKPPEPASEDDEDFEDDGHEPAILQEDSAWGLWKLAGAWPLLPLGAMVILGAWILKKRRGRR
jgi:hypothetical protein